MGRCGGGPFTNNIKKIKMIENIITLWREHCVTDTKNKILNAIVSDSRLNRCKSLQSAREVYFFKKDYKDGEAEVVLDIVQNALRLQCENINSAIS